MNAALLKQAREALQAIAAGDIPHEKKLEWMGLSEEAYYECRAEYFQEVAASKIAALTAFDGVSVYDKAIHALAPYLPDGWVAQDEDGYMSHDSVMPSPCQHGGGDWKTPPRVNAVSYRLSCLRIPRCPDWRSSLRRITHNSDGTVTVERG